MIDALSPPITIASLRMNAARHAAAIAQHSQTTARTLRDNPDLPTGPRPTFAVTALEHLHAAQKVVPKDAATEPDLAPQAARTALSPGSINRIL